MKNFIFPIVILLLLCACGGNTTNPVSGGETKDSLPLSAPPSFTISLKAVSNNPKVFPWLQSFAWARQGNKLVMLGGRIEGFHGLPTTDSAFKTSKANTSLWVVNLDDYSYSQLPLDMTNPDNLQYAGTNMLFCQDGNNFYIAGGYCQQNVGDKQANNTSNRLVSFNVSKLITAIESGGDFTTAIQATTTSPFVQVTGGEMFSYSGTFHIVCGQNYSSRYNTGRTGNYSSAIRKFSFTGPSISDTQSLIDTNLHRRDLNVVAIYQRYQTMYAAFGGVFTPKDNGYLNPVLIDLNNMTAQPDTLRQWTCQYACANATVFDVASNTNFTILMGGIGQYRYNDKLGNWEEGYEGAPLPFVNSITQMIYCNGKFSQHIQTPPAEPTMPALLGANAIFIPDQALLGSGESILYSKLTQPSQRIGWMYGGILSPKPVSSNVYPTSVNKTIYEVWLTKNEATQ